jgi:HK97 family phage major capsid protein
MEMKPTVVLEQRAQVLGQARAMLDKADEEKRELSAEELTQYDGLMAQADKMQADFERRQRLEAEEAKLEKPEKRQSSQDPQTGMPNLNLKTKLGDDETRALSYFFRTGDQGALRASNATGMNIGTQADGGYAVPTAHYNNIIARRDEDAIGPKLGLQRFGGIGTTMNVPVDDEADGEFVSTSEMGDDNTTNVYDRDAPALNTRALTYVKYTKKVELTEELLQDEDSNLVAFVEGFVARGMAKTHNQLLVTEALADGTAALTLDSASTIGAGEVPELWYLLPDYYATDEASVAWIMRRATEGIIRGLAGTTMFYYAPTPGGSITIGRPMLWGAPVYQTGKMAAITGSAKTILLGNWYYMALRESPVVTMIRDPYTVDGKVILKYGYRCVYKVLQAAAIIYATHPTG